MEPIGDDDDHTQAAATTTLQTSLAMDPEEKKQVQSIRDQLKGHSLPDGGEIVGSINSSSSEFNATNNRASIFRQYESDYTAFDFGYTYFEEKYITISPFTAWAAFDFGDTNFEDKYRTLLEDLRQDFVCVCSLKRLLLFVWRFIRVSIYTLLAIYLLGSKVPPPPEAQYPYPNQYPYPYPYQYPISLENLQQCFGLKRADAAARLGVSVSTFKRICKEHRINPWPYPYRKGSSGSVSKPPDQHGERNPPSTCKTLSTNGQTEMENEMVGHHAEVNEFILDFDDGPNEAGVSSEWASQLINQWTVSAAHPNSSGLVVPQPHMASQILGENMGSLEEWGNSFASLEEPLLPSHDSGSMSTVPPCSSPVPNPPMPTIPHTLGSSEDQRNLLAFLEDTRSVMLKATYGDITIRFQLPLTCGIGKLKEEVSKRLEFEPGSYHVEYKDEDGTWIIINCDEDVRIFLHLFTSLGNQVIKLRVRDKVPNTTKFCQCGHATDH